MAGSKNQSAAGSRAASASRSDARRPVASDAEEDEVVIKAGYFLHPFNPKRQIKKDGPLHKQLIKGRVVDDDGNVDDVEAFNAEKRKFDAKVASKKSEREVNAIVKKFSGLTATDLIVLASKIGSELKSPSRKDELGFNVLDAIVNKLPTTTIDKSSQQGSKVKGKGKAKPSGGSGKGAARRATQHSDDDDAEIDNALKDDDDDF